MPPNKHVRRLDSIQSRKAQPDVQEVLVVTPAEAPSKKPRNKTSVAAGEAPARRAPASAVIGKSKVGQANKRSFTICSDMFAPMPYDVGARDNRCVMDVALFRLSKRDIRANSVIRYDLPNGYVQVSSGLCGMASIWDYDIVLMAISHLNEAMNRYRAGKGEKPGQIFCPRIDEILSFCKKNVGGSQKDKLIEALERLSTTHILIERTRNVGGLLKTLTEGENLITSFSIVSNSKTKAVESIRIRIADWMFDEITKGHKPDVLTVHKDYFSISQGVGRFIYRLSCRTAGKRMALWGFHTLYEHSGSAGTLKEFSRLLRKVIQTQCVPEYSVAEDEGKEGPMLRIVHHSQREQWNAL